MRSACSRCWRQLEAGATVNANGGAAVTVVRLRFHHSCTRPLILHTIANIAAAAASIAMVIQNSCKKDMRGVLQPGLNILMSKFTREAMRITSCSQERDAGR